MGDYRSFIEDLEKQIKSMQKDRSELEITLASYKQRFSLISIILSDLTFFIY